MELLIIGGDVRFAHLAHMAVSRGVAAVHLTDLVDGVNPMDMIGRAGALLMPNPWRGQYRLPHRTCPHEMDTIIDALPDSSTVLLFGSDAMPARFAAHHHRRIVNLLEYEPFVLRNAVLTAEGGIASAMAKSDRALGTSSALVIGYGRIGRALTGMLRGLGAKVTVCARRAEVRLQIEQEGARAADMQALPSMVGDMDFIFSTPPQPVLHGEVLPLIKRSACLIDLGSQPYGFDLDLAIRLGLKATREPGLPGRYCPISAAEALLDAVLEHIQKE